MDLNQLQSLAHKTINNTDIDEHLALPGNLVAHMGGANPNGPRERFFQVMDRLGVRWDLKADIKWGPNGELRPEVGGRKWNRFVRDNGLRVDDRLVFYRHPDPNPNPNQVVFVVSIKRDMTLMGGTFSGHITPFSG